MNEMEIDVVYISPDGYIETDYIDRFIFTYLKDINEIINLNTDLCDLRDFIVCCRNPKFYTLQSPRKENSYITLTIFNIQDELAELIEGYVHDNIEIQFIDMIILQVKVGIITWDQAIKFYDRMTDEQI